MPARIGRVLRLLRRLIDRGRQLAETVRQRATEPGFALVARPFGTADLAVILARITSGLRRAAALEAALNERAARGRDLTPSPAPSPRVPRAAAQPDARPEPRRAGRTQDPRLARLPTEEEIAADVRRRPVGAVIADICRDLGIAPGHLDRAFWDELAHAIVSYGGSLSGYFNTMNQRLLGTWSDNGADPAERGSPAAPPGSPVPATGPP